MSVHRRPLYFNAGARSCATKSFGSAKSVSLFHKQLKDYRPSPLVPLHNVAEDVGVKAVYAKDETNRLGLPAVNILGLSWAIFQALANRLGLPGDVDIEAMRARLSETPVPLFTASGGNHALAVARMGMFLESPVHIHVPAHISTETISLLRMENAVVVQSSGAIDDARLEAQIASQEKSGILIQEDSINGCCDSPQLIAEGYSTIMHEIDLQLAGEQPSMVICPIGSGSLAQAVVTHYKAQERGSTAFMAVEPDASGVLWKSLTHGTLAVEINSTTTRPELNYGVLSETAWPLLKSGTDASITVSDYEEHRASLELQSLGIAAGPSGAASLAALRALNASDKVRLGLNRDSIIILMCTEGGPTKNDIPKDVASDDVIELTQTLVQIDSSNPDFGSIPGPGEISIAQYITAWLQHRDIECHWIEPTPGRPSIVGVARGSGGGKSLMFNGHMDTVTLIGYNGDPLNAIISDGNLYGRGTADMKSGLAAGMVAIANAKGMSLRGDVILAAVADEESESLGTEQLLQAGWLADAAIIAEPTEMALINKHKGFALFQVDIHGLAAHGSRADLGVDAICKAGYFLVELDRHAEELRNRFDGGEPESAAPNIHAGVIRGGEEIASYPACCTISIERRTVAGETAESVRLELLSILDKLAATVPGFKFDLRLTFSRAPYFIPREDEFVQLVAKHAALATKENPRIKGETYWTDMALLGEAGIPGLIWGPKGHGLHAKTEWVEIESVRQLAAAFVAVVAAFCK
ncbi:hypothetical protein AJ78_01980 [Emergomyces pasteurianus Ep9510]|uniref:Probable succinyl-diaminopimelate desuccinylase n=1 Tax=Emergomyces pasteurianus Ep9510 TaxID=1447872 RepID=A0A1J9QRR0_9EURO|nr:hypothetical protein AJ78_01980 [Emergomyces pasteurianus Ep9510]